MVTKGFKELLADANAEIEAISAEQAMELAGSDSLSAINSSRCQGIGARLKYRA